MPGPCNNVKKKQKLEARKAKKRSKCKDSVETKIQHSFSPTPTPSRSPSPPTPSDFESPPPLLTKGHDYDPWAEILLQKPYIYDPGNGPRVRNARAFLDSYFAQPPALDEPLCAEFAQDEVLQMLCTVLPEETALILWYNKSRSTGRICPACRRLYRLGDVLPDHLEDDRKRTPSKLLPQLEREQQISGFCSPVCFILASYDYPNTVKLTWGQMADELDDQTWELLNGPGTGLGDKSLGMLLRMTRLDDLGLGQLCLPDVDFTEVDHTADMDDG